MPEREVAPGEREREREREKERKRETEKQRNRETEKQRNRETEKQRNRETEKQREKQRNRERNFETISPVPPFLKPSCQTLTRICRLYLRPFSNLNMYLVGQTSQLVLENKVRQVSSYAALYPITMTVQNHPILPDIYAKWSTVSTYVGTFSHAAVTERRQITTTVFNQVLVFTTGCTAATCSERTSIKFHTAAQDSKPCSFGRESDVLAIAPQRSFLQQIHS